MPGHIVRVEAETSNVVTIADIMDPNSQLYKEDVEQAQLARAKRAQEDRDLELQAREEDRRKLAENAARFATPNAVTWFPKLGENEAYNASDFLLDSYLLHIQHTTCKCGNIFSSSTLFEVWTLRTSRRLRAITTPPIDKLSLGTSTLPPKTTSICFRCVEAHPARETFDSEAAWRATLLRKSAERAEARTVSRAEPTHVTPPTLDQL